jgi:type III secretion protein J
MPGLPRALAVAATVAAVLGASGCSVELEHALDERQANEVVAVLDRSGVQADKAPDEGPASWKVVVPRAEAAQAFLVLESYGLPRRNAKGVGEAFGDKGLLPSRTAERARLAASLAVDLERTLEGLPGVAAARVHLALPDEDPLGPATDHPRPTASVLVRSRGPLSTSDADVRKLVAGALPGLQPADVSVVIAPALDDAPAPALVDVGPLKVARGSRRLALGLGGGALGLILALALALAVGAFRLASLRRKLRDR